MPVTDERPSAAIGHVRFNVTDVEATARWLATVGLRTIVASSDFAVLDVHGAAPLAVTRAAAPPAPSAIAPFALPCNRSAVIRRLFQDTTALPSSIQRAPIHAALDVVTPDRWLF